MDTQQTIPVDSAEPQATLLRDLRSGDAVDMILLVRKVETRQRRDGGTYARVELGDRSATVTAVVWENVDEITASCPQGSAVRIIGRYDKHERFGPQITIATVERPAVESIDSSLLYDGPEKTLTQLATDFHQLIASIENHHLKRLLEQIFTKDGDTWQKYQDAPAAKHVHQAYKHGLLEHTLSVAQAVDAVSHIFPEIQRDLAVSGALLHDIGKIDTYQEVGNWAAIEFSDNGKLLGEIPTGYWIVRCEIKKIEEFPHQLELALLHIILSHHGALEFGSPVVPCTREATLVHFMDNLGGRLGSFDRLERELQEQEPWSRYDRSLGTSAFFYHNES